MRLDQIPILGRFMVPERASGATRIKSSESERQLLELGPLEPEAALAKLAATDRGLEPSQVEERLGRASAEPGARPLLDAQHVRVKRQDVHAEREVRHRCGGVAPDTRERRQIVRPPVERDRLRGAVQVERAPVVAQPLPGADHLGRRRGRKLSGCRPALEPGEVARNDPVDQPS